jgi:hypothetical protein
MSERVRCGRLARDTSTVECVAGRPGDLAPRAPGRRPVVALERRRQRLFELQDSIAFPITDARGPGVKPLYIYRHKFNCIQG